MKGTLSGVEGFGLETATTVVRELAVVGNPTVFATTFPSASFPSGHNTFQHQLHRRKYMPSSVQVKY
uniref:Uncharacterized protein n=1 Tax=Ditylenchus dipsaci TaxID=166011 RepID=A0A915ENS3_9BILA